MDFDGVSIITTPSNNVTFTNVCPGSYTLMCMDNMGQFGYTFVIVPTYTANPPVIQNVTYTPAPNPPYHPFQYIANVNYSGGSSPYTITWYNYSTIPPSVIATHTTNNLQDTISLYPGDYGVSVTDQASSYCGTTPVTYTFSICDNLVVLLLQLYLVPLPPLVILIQCALIPLSPLIIFLSLMRL